MRGKDAARLWRRNWTHKCRPRRVKPKCPAPVFVGRARGADLHLLPMWCFIGGQSSRGPRVLGRYDRYILFQLIAVFSFFSLVLIAVYWINAAVPLFGSLIASGQTIRIFLGFSLLIVPQVSMMVLPVAGFIAALYVFNRKIGDSELLVLQTAGFSATRLLRPVLMFGILTGLLVGLVGNIVAPAARSLYSERTQQLEENLTGRFLREGQFINPTAGLTVFVRDITELGEFQDMFLQDRSDPLAETTYIAPRALLVAASTGPQLMMFDGMAQTLDHADQRLSIVRFEEFAYDLNAVNPDRGVPSRDLREFPTRALLSPDPRLARELGLSVASMRYEGHDRIARALFVMFPPLIGAICLMLGSFSRFGVVPQILLSVALIVGLQFLWNLVDTVAARNGAPFLYCYLKPLGALVMALVLTLIAMKGPRWRWRWGRGAVLP